MFGFDYAAQSVFFTERMKDILFELNKVDYTQIVGLCKTRPIFNTICTKTFHAILDFTFS